MVRTTSDLFWITLYEDFFKCLFRMQAILPLHTLFFNYFLLIAMFSWKWQWSGFTFSPPQFEIQSFSFLRLVATQGQISCFLVHSWDNGGKKDRFMPFSSAQCESRHNRDTWNLNLPLLLVIYSFLHFKECNCFTT